VLKFGRIICLMVSCFSMIALWTQGAWAEQPASTVYYASLLSQGFEVKNVLLISASDSSRLSGSLQQQDSVLVTLQKGDTTATCWLVFSVWNQQSLGGQSAACNILH